MFPDAFEHFAYLLQPLIQKQNTTFRQKIFIKERLAVTFCYLASGNPHQSLNWSHRIGKGTVSNIIK